MKRRGCVPVLEHILRFERRCKGEKKKRESDPNSNGSADEYIFRFLGFGVLYSAARNIKTPSLFGSCSYPGRLRQLDARSVIHENYTDHYAGSKFEVSIYCKLRKIKIKRQRRVLKILGYPLRDAGNAFFT